MSQPIGTEIMWNEAYGELYPYIKKLVYRLNVPAWRGQEEEIAWDIMQESMCRFVEYARKADSGERAPVRSAIALLKVIAQHYGRDLRRQARRLSRADPAISREPGDDGIDISQVAVENIYRDGLFGILAHEIAAFPEKQQRSLLADLAGRMAFLETHTALELAFRTEGICLEEYRRDRSESEQERRRNTALLSHAYKRLKSLEAVQKYRWS